MKDRQVKSDSGTGDIPLVSPVLHCVAMSGLVFLRSSFGYLYLGPKAIFLSFAYALLLYAFYAWHEPQVWHTYGAFVVFSVAAVALYISHLSVAFVGQLRRTAKHDKYSGSPHLVRFLRPFVRRNANAAEIVVKLWIEPSLILGAAAILHFAFREPKLSLWLAIVGAALWSKEFLNFWHTLRAEKRRQDVLEDAEESFDHLPQIESSPVPSDAGRKKRVPKQRSFATADSEEEQRHAATLGVSPPYHLAEIEQSYRERIKACHPDLNDPSPQNITQAAALNAALDYFRAKLSESN